MARAWRLPRTLRPSWYCTRAWKLRWAPCPCRLGAQHLVPGTHHVDRRFLAAFSGRNTASITRRLRPGAAGRGESSSRGTAGTGAQYHRSAPPAVNAPPPPSRAARRAPPPRSSTGASSSRNGRRQRRDGAAMSPPPSPRQANATRCHRGPPAQPRGGAELSRRRATCAPGSSQNRLAANAPPSANASRAIVVVRCVDSAGGIRARRNRREGAGRSGSCARAGTARHRQHDSSAHRRRDAEAARSARRPDGSPRPRTRVAAKWRWRNFVRRAAAQADMPSRRAGAATAGHPSIVRV